LKAKSIGWGKEWEGRKTGKEKKWEGPREKRL